MSTGGFATVLRRGHEQAGVVFIALRDRDGTSRVFAEVRDLDGVLDWEVRHTGLTDSGVSEWLHREVGFDPDLWVVEIEGMTPDVILAQKRN